MRRTLRRLCWWMDVIRLGMRYSENGMGSLMWEVQRDGPILFTAG
jgi:hypothetical protein